MAKASVDLRSLARAHTVSAIATLALIMRQKKGPPAARVAAAVALLDRGWGKPVQGMALTDPTGEKDRLAELLAEIDGKSRGLVSE